MKEIDYEFWRDDLFGQPESSDPVFVELKSQTYQLSSNNSLEFIETALSDTSIHELYSPIQIGIGFNIIYSNSCSDYPFLYLDKFSEDRTTQSLEKLTLLYKNYFQKYCWNEVPYVGAYDDGNKLGFLCYMFWDIFVVFPGNSSLKMVNSCLKVMEEAINMENESCIVSAIHGLGHFAMDSPNAQRILLGWLETTDCTKDYLIEYANQAVTGCIQKTTTFLGF